MRPGSRSHRRTGTAPRAPLLHRHPPATLRGSRLRALSQNCCYFSRLFLSPPSDHSFLLAPFLDSDSAIPDVWVVCVERPRLDRMSPRFFFSDNTTTVLWPCPRICPALSNPPSDSFFEQDFWRRLRGAREEIETKDSRRRLGKGARPARLSQERERERGRRRQRVGESRGRGAGNGAALPPFHPRFTGG